MCSLVVSLHNAEVFWKLQHITEQPLSRQLMHYDPAHLHILSLIGVNLHLTQAQTHTRRVHIYAHTCACTQSIQYWLGSASRLGLILSPQDIVIFTTFLLLSLVLKH